MCIHHKIDRNQISYLIYFFAPIHLIVGYIIFVLHISSLGRHISMFPEYQKYNANQTDETEEIEENENGFQKQSNNISDFFYEFDGRFDTDEVDSKGFSNIATADMSILEDGKKQINFQRFYHEFLSYNMPILFKNGAKHWPAFVKWQQDQYLIDKIGDKTISVEVRSDGSNKFAYFEGNFENQEMTYKDFASIYNKPDRKGNYYWAENDIPQELTGDLVEPELGIFMNLQSTRIWQGASGTESLPHTDDQDNFLCQVSGIKRIVLIPSTQRSKLYVGMGRKKVLNYSEVDFFEPDYEKYPLFKEVKGKMLAEIGPGDILFIPSFWWHHVKSQKGRNIAVSFWYSPNFINTILDEGFQQSAFK